MSTSTTTEPRVIKPGEGESNPVGGVFARYLLDGAETDQRLSVVEHPMPPRALAAPLHRHLHEDEYSFVIEGRMGAQLGDQVVYAEAGDFVFKPRNQWHTFWNAGDEPALILEIISPAGFEEFFRALGRNPENLPALAEEYGLEFDVESLPRLIEEHGLVIPELPL